MNFIVPVITMLFLISACGKQDRGLLEKELITKQSEVIYGKDDRKELFKITDPTLQNLSQYVGVSIEKSMLKHKKKKKIYTVNYMQLKEQDINLCNGEALKFKEQYNPGDCTGFLLTQNLYITMAHCLTPDFINSDEVEKINKIKIVNERIIFNYFQNKNGEKIIIPEANVYSIKKILDINYQNNGSDYAILELDRIFPKKVSLPLETVSKSKVGDRLVMLGYPQGLPLKVTDNGQIIRDINESQFGSNLDAFGGNSGSLVYNLETNEIVGLLERGQPDYIFDPIKKCNRVNIQEENPKLIRGEIIQKMTDVFEKSKLENLPR